MVVVDRLSKYAHFMPISHPFTVAKVANIFILNVFELHGLPYSIVTDRMWFSPADFGKRYSNWKAQIYL